MHGETPMKYQSVKEGWGWGNLYKWEKERRARRTEGRRQESAWRLWLSTEARLVGKNVVPALTGHVVPIGPRSSWKEPWHQWKTVIIPSLGGTH